MLILRLTSHPRVIGIQSDDDFTIGRFTLCGTYNLLVLGAAFGIIGAAVYQWVRPWLIGPQWFRYLTVGLASGAVVGSMLIHADGIDFRALTPTWLAIGAVHRLAVPVRRSRSRSVVDRLDRPESFTRHGRARWIVVGILAWLFPLTLILLGISAARADGLGAGPRDAWHAEGQPPPAAFVTVIARGVGWASPCSG